MGLELEEDFKRKPVALALAAARKRQSPQTGFIHLCNENQVDQRHDTIPLLENFCFALALFRSRLSDHVLEGKALVEKLLPFEVDGNFPVYLHEFPQCKDDNRAFHILPVLRWLIADFHLLLGEEVLHKLNALAARIETKGKGRVSEEPATPAEWVNFLIHHSEGWKKAAGKWDPALHTFIGPQSAQQQEKNQPAVTLFDLFMGQLFRSYSKRALEDHPVHLRAALIPAFDPVEAPPALSHWRHLEEKVFTLLWGDKEQVHSLIARPKKSELYGEANTLFFKLSEALPEERDDGLEVAFYCDVHEDHSFLVEGEKAITFQLGEEVKIISKGMTISLKFEIEKGEGVFFGHLARGNRPQQLCTKGEHRFEAYDWQIGLRTIRRSPDCTIKAHLTTETG